MNDWLLAVLVLGGMLFLWDVWRLVREWSAAVDRDQQILDQQILDQITVHEPDDDDGPQFAIDLAMNEADATLAFIEQFRAIKEQHGHNND